MNCLNEMIQQAEYYHRWSWDMKLLTRQGCTYNIQPGSKEIKIAIIDSGVDRNHPDLAHSIVSEGKSFIDDMPATVDLSGHGTMMAGAIAARGKLLGIGPGLGIVPYKIIQTNNSGHSSDVIKAIDLAIDDRNDIINLSLGSYKSTIGESDAGLIREYNQIIRKAASKGIIVVGSMGTHGMFLSKKSEYCHVPGGLSHVISVAATNKEGMLADYSNYNSGNNYAVPAGDFGPSWKKERKPDFRSMCVVTYPAQLDQTPQSKAVKFDQGYEFMTGTSLAAAKMSGIIGLIQSQALEKRRQKLNKGQIIHQLRRTSKRLVHNGVVFYLVQPYEALRLIY
ncbi:S8 family serine peptidase [Paenibacillus larvae]